MNIRPLHDRVIIRRIEEEKTTASGLIIPDAAAEKPLEGVNIYANISNKPCQCRCGFYPWRKIVHQQKYRSSNINKNSLYHLYVC
jgi:hypothetical protein